MEQEKRFSAEHGGRVFQSDDKEALDSFLAAVKQGEENAKAIEDPASRTLIDRFLQAAQRGANPAASGGEQRAYRLRALMLQAIEECANTDIEVVEGACRLMRFASYGGDGYCLARDLLRRDDA